MNNTCDVILDNDMIYISDNNDSMYCHKFNYKIRSDFDWNQRILQTC